MKETLIREIEEHVKLLSKLTGNTVEEISDVLFETYQEENEKILRGEYGHGN